jgi:hypothetical protein
LSKSEHRLHRLVNSLFCSPSGIDIEKLKEEKIKAERAKREEEFKRQPEILCQIEVGGGPDGRRPGMVVDPKTGEQKYVSYQPKLHNPPSQQSNNI